MTNRSLISNIAVFILILSSSALSDVNVHDLRRIFVEDSDSGLIFEQLLEPISDIDFPPDTAHTLIDIRDVDTTIFEELYEFWLRLPISSRVSTPVVIGDTDKDNLTEIIGYYRTTRPQWTDSLNRTRMYEYNGQNGFRLTHIYPDSTNNPISLQDLDRDSFDEILIRNYGQYMRVFESDSTQPAINEVYRYPLWEVQSTLSHEIFYDTDEDGQMEMLHIGDSDTLPHESMIVAEYDTVEKKLIRRFIMDPTVDYNSSLGLGIGDFDDDGKMELISSSGRGDVYVVENRGNDSWELTWQGDAGIFNAWMDLGTNDIDSNGKPEFFAGGSSFHDSLGSLTRFTQFEYVEDDSFKPVAVIDMYPVGGFFLEMMSVVDADGDGDNELLTVIAGRVLILESFAPGRYRIVWMKRIRGGGLKGALIADVTGDGYKELMVSYDNFTSLEGSNERLFTDIYRLREAVSVDDEYEALLPQSHELYQNYPNPFNPVTTIEFNLPAAGKTTLTIYNLTGQEVARLVDDDLSPGIYSYDWNASELSSGIYIYKLSSNEFTESRKMVLVK